MMELSNNFRNWGELCKYCFEEINDNFIEEHYHTEHLMIIAFVTIETGV